MDAKDLIDVLVEQNKTYKEMMQFAITSIITLLVIFLTANFFVMRKMRKDEIEKLQAEMKSDIILGIKERELPDIEKQMNERLTTLVGDKLRSFDSRLNSFDKKLQSLTNMQSSQVKGFNMQFMELRGDFHYLEGEFSLSEKVYENAFNNFLDAGNAYVEADSGGIDSVLSRLEDTADKLNYVESELSDFNEFGKKLDDIHEHRINKVIDILKTKKGIGDLVDYDDDID